MKVIVLNDGETFTNVGGCKLIDVDEKRGEDPNLDYLLKCVARDGEEVKGIKVLGTFNNDGGLTQ